MNIVWTFFEVCNSFFEIFIMKMLAEGFLKEKKSCSDSLKTAVFIIGALISFSISTLLNDNFIAIALKTLVISFGVSQFFSVGKWYWKIIVASLCYLIFGIGELLAAHIIGVADNMSAIEVSMTESYKYQALALADLVIFLIVKLLIRFRKNNTRKIPAKTLILLCMLPMFSIIMTLQIIFNAESDNTPETFFSVLGIVGLLYTNMIVFYIVENIIRDAKNKEKLLAAEIQLAVQKEHNEKLVENQLNIRQMSHDFKQQVQGFISLCEDNKIDELKENLNSIIEKQIHVKPMFNTGNTMLDALITSKRDYAENKSIICFWDINLPPNLKISISDLSALLGNALDNAIEACLRTDGKKFIKFILRTEDNTILCEIKNTTGKLPKIENGKIKSLKDDTLHHGIGLKSMKKCCASLGGEMSYDFDESIFELRILMPF